MHEKGIMFAQLAHYWGRDKIEHAGIADALRSSSETSAMDHPKYRRHYHIEYTSPSLREHVGNIADMSPMCLRHFESWCTLPNIVLCRCLGEAWPSLAYVADHY